MLNVYPTSWSKVINPALHLLRVMCAVCAVLLISIDPSLNSFSSSQSPDVAALEKTSGPKSETGRENQLSLLPPLAIFTVSTPRLLIHEQNTSFVSSLTPRDHKSTGSARAPPFSV